MDSSKSQHIYEGDPNPNQGKKAEARPSGLREIRRKLKARLSRAHPHRRRATTTVRAFVGSRREGQSTVNAPWRSADLLSHSP
jgi:hypothetical protein